VSQDADTHIPLLWPVFIIFVINLKFRNTSQVNRRNTKDQT